MPTSGRNYVLDKGYDTGGAITKFRGVKHSADQTVVQVTASTDKAVGIAQESVSSAEQARGKGVPVALMGITEAEAGGAVAVGDDVMFDTSGRVVLAATAGNRVIGSCVGSPTTATGQRTMVRLALPGRVL